MKKMNYACSISRSRASDKNYSSLGKENLRGAIESLELVFSAALPIIQEVQQKLIRKHTF